MSGRGRGERAIYNIPVSLGFNVIYLLIRTHTNGIEWPTHQKSATWSLSNELLSSFTWFASRNLKYEKLPTSH